MEIISSINERWKLCSYACIIGCIILFFVLNRSHVTVDLSNLRDLGMSQTSFNISNTSYVTIDSSNLRDLGMSWASSNTSNTIHVAVNPSNLRDLGMSWTSSNTSNTIHVAVNPSNLRDLGMSWTSSNASNTSHVLVNPSNLRDLGMSWTSSNASNTSYVTVDPSKLRDLGTSWTSSNASNTSYVTVDPSKLRDLGTSWTSSNASNTSYVTVDPSKLRDLGTSWTSSNASNSSHITIDPSKLRDLGTSWTSSNVSNSSHITVNPWTWSNVSNSSHITVNPSKLRDLGMSWTSSNVSNSIHVTVDSSNLQDLSMSSTSSNASNTSMQVLQLSSLVEEMKVEKNEEEEKCNIFEGKWVYDPKGSPAYYGSQCPFLGEKVRCQKNGRPDSEYEKWSWEAKGCKIPRYNGKDMLEKLRGKRVIIVGDSLNRNQWESLACLLYSSLSPSQTHIEVHSGHYRLFKAKEYDCSVEFYWSPFIVKLEVNKANGDRILNLDKLPAVTEKWKGADFMVFNTGHWWVHTGKLRAWDLFRYGGKSVKEMEIESALGMAMKTWARWINQNVDTTKTRVFFRSISPEHKGRQWCYNESQPITDESYIKIFPAKIIQTVERTIQGMKTPVTYLNITKLSEYRRDGHPSIYRTKDGKTMVETRQKQPKTFADCSHWCLPGLPDTWNRLLFASILLETPKNISTS